MAVTPVVGAGYIKAVESLAEQINDGTGTPAATETVNGTVKRADYVAVPASFADLAAVRTYLLALQAAMVAANQQSPS